MPFNTVVSTNRLVDKKGKEKVDKLEVEIALLEEKINAHNQTLAEYKKEKLSLKKLEAEKVELDEKIQKRLEENKAEELVLSNIKQSIDNALVELNKVKSECEDVIETKVKIEEEITVYQTKLDDIKKDIEEERIKADTFLKESEQKVNELNLKFIEIQLKIKDEEEKLSTFNLTLDELNELKAEKAKQELEISSLRLTGGNLSKEIVGLNEQKDLIVNEITLINKKNEEEKERYENYVQKKDEELTQRESLLSLQEKSLNEKMAKLNALKNALVIIAPEKIQKLNI